jgi:hypothetical protein
VVAGFGQEPGLRGGRGCKAAALEELESYTAGLNVVRDGRWVDIVPAGRTSAEAARIVRAAKDCRRDCMVSGVCGRLLQLSLARTLTVLVPTSR